MNTEFFLAIEEIEKEKGIPKSYMIEKIMQALLAAVRKDDPETAEGVVVDIDAEKRKINIYIQRTVVEEVSNPALELTLDQARETSPKAEIGDIIKTDVETKKFGRIAAQAAKQVIIQGIREAERGMIYEEFTSKEHEILTGVVSRVDPRTGNIYIKIASSAEITEAVLLTGEQVPSENLREGDRVKVYLVEVRRSTKGPQVIISRTHPGLVKRLFELEVPEIFDGIVEIKSIAREAGSRTKIAVWSNDPTVDPIGACVGPKGARVSGIVDELKGEKIDIIQYDESPEAFVAAALAPAEVYSVTLLEDGKSCRVIAPDNQLSLAIGKEGKNARLAAKLTGYKIDIRPASEMINTSRLKTESGQSLEDFDNDLDDDIDDNFDE
ncbi:MAG: transcription termination/antitermination protein NusA [Clostridiales bacterium]|nr:transcription termination/antitermination protein NusA [Clostridiales bacterium]